MLADVFKSSVVSEVAAVSSELSTEQSLKSSCRETLVIPIFWEHLVPRVLTVSREGCIQYSHLSDLIETSVV